MKPLKNQYLTERGLKLSFLKTTFWCLLIGIGIISCNQNKQPQQDKQPEQPKTQESSIEHKELPIWTKSIPDSELITGVETYNDEMISNVSNPTVTIYSPKGKNTGAAVIVFPGGGYRKLAIELEGSEVCEWLASIGVTGILLKYRVPNSGPHHDDDCHCQKDAEKPLALQDAQRAVSLARFDAKEWNIDPNKIGVMGFSAGGHLVADVSTNYKKRAYPIMDETDKISCRPDFGMVIFPGHMMFHTTKAYELNPTIPVDGDTPPTFILSRPQTLSHWAGEFLPRFIFQ